jgi:hypothetical protein
MELGHASRLKFLESKDVLVIHFKRRNLNHKKTKVSLSPTLLIFGIHLVSAIPLR